MLTLLLWSLISVNACPSAGGFDLSDLTGEMSFNYQNGAPGFLLTFAFCGLEENSCGTEPEDMCRDKPNCCGACQRWMDDDSSRHGKCLGIFSQVLVNPNGTISLLYTGGDPIQPPSPPGPRNTWINLTWDASATTPVVTDFIRPSTDGHVPGTPYWYTIKVATAAVCGCGPKWPTCTACTTQGKFPCEWCLETRKCTPQKGTCKNWIRNSSGCPACQANTCGECLSAGLGSCEWCIKEGCASSGSTCQIGKIVDPKYCPK